MLIYHPGYDAYHCIFRLLAVIDHVQDLEIDKARILEFFLLYPSAVAQIKIPQGMTAIRKEAKLLSNQYHDPINIKTTFRDMRFIQDAALKCIAAASLIDLDRFELGYITRTEVPIPESLNLYINSFIRQHENISQFVLEELSAMPLFGQNGLKHRTELMEYRYDFIQADS
ncbi:ABC-three component system middle component 5 [Massilia sp. YIM B04103]|uniref:ABC-three component system middle component 5 n=1 Tax=Massilia sp. YIM B04103 TaxID=2963106 RepID=UPI00210976EB|nr:ABC-three component system middle component 5 [Massilia sp. YIM B04103]